MNLHMMDADEQDLSTSLKSDEGCRLAFIVLSKILEGHGLPKPKIRKENTTNQNIIF